MNEWYTYIDGKVIISDEKGNHTQSEYYDNLDKVLVQQNIIEEMENKIKELTQEREKYKIKHFPYLSLTIGTVVVATPLLLWSLTGTNPYLLDFETVYGSFNLVSFLTAINGAWALPIGSSLSLYDYSNYKNKIKKVNGINSELEFLKLQVEREKETLISLQSNKTRNNEKIECKSVQVDDLQQLKMLKKHLELYYDLGYNEDRYRRYYQHQNLDKKLERLYSESEIVLAKEYFKEKENVLVKKKII